MIIIAIAILLGLAILVWLWKVPIKKMVESMQKNGSSAFEAYMMITLLTSGLALAVYYMYKVL